MSVIITPPSILNFLHHFSFILHNETFPFQYLNQEKRVRKFKSKNRKKKKRETERNEGKETGREVE
jgi:hypothetical protein